MEGLFPFGFPRVIPGVYLAVFKRLSGCTFAAFVFQSFERFETEIALRIAQGIPKPFIRLYDSKISVNE
jgi:hypothetical protein